MQPPCLMGIHLFTPLSPPLFCCFLLLDLSAAPSQATAHIWSRGVLAAVLAQPVQEVEESHPMLLRNLHSLAERYFMLPQVARRMREVSCTWACFRLPDGFCCSGCAVSR
jgi:hypothetical protein